jgi:hypothetical protein
MNTLDQEKPDQITSEENVSPLPSPALSSDSLDSFKHERIQTMSNIRSKRL